MGEMEPMVNTVLKYPMVDTDRLNNPALTAKPEIPGNSEKKPENYTVAAEPEVNETPELFSQAEMVAAEIPEQVAKPIPAAEAAALL